MSPSLYESRDQTNIYGLYPLTRPNRNAHAKYDGEHVDDEFNAWAPVCIHRRDQANIYDLYPLTRPNRNTHAKYDSKDHIIKMR